MNELDRITVTVTRIMYGFDESELEKEGVNLSLIHISEPTRP